MTVTVDYLTGFETGLLSTNGSAGGAGGSTGLIAVQTNATLLSGGTQRNGSYAVRVSPGAAAGGSVRWNLVQAGVTMRSWRFAFRISTAPASGSVDIFEVHLSATMRGAVRISSAGVLEASADGTNWTAGGASVTDSAWHVLEVILDYTNATNVVNWRVDGVTQTTASAATATTSPSIFTCGTTGVTGPAAVIDIDDVITGLCTTTSDWLGNGRIVALVPGSDGTHSMTANDFAFGDAGANISNATTTVNTVLDEIPWSATRDTADAVRQAVARTTSYCEVAPATTSETATANAVIARLSYSSPGASPADTGGCVVRNSAGTAKVIWGDLPVAQGGLGGALADYTETSNFFKNVVATAPAAGWTPTEVNAIRWRFGGADDIAPLPTWQALILEADYPITAGPPAENPPPIAAMAPYVAYTSPQ